jgi:hypothetical protein
MAHRFLILLLAKSDLCQPGPSLRRLRRDFKLLLKRCPSSIDLAVRQVERPEKPVEPGHRRLRLHGGFQKLDGLLGALLLHEGDSLGTRRGDGLRVGPRGRVELRESPLRILLRGA